MRCVVYSAWCVFCSCLFMALGGASHKTWILKGMPRFIFRAGRGGAKLKARRRNGNAEEIDDDLCCRAGGVLLIRSN